MKTLIGIALFVCFFVLSPMVMLAGDSGNKSESSGNQQSSDTQGTRVTGQLTHIEGWHYTIKDAGGQEVSFGVTSETNDPDKVKEGDHIVAMIREDRIALNIKNIKKKS